MSTVRAAFAQAQAQHAQATGQDIHGTTLAASLATMRDRLDMFREHLETMPVRYLGDTWVVTLQGVYLELTGSGDSLRAVPVNLDDAKRMTEAQARRLAAEAYNGNGRTGEAISLGDALRREVASLTLLTEELAALLGK
ncbi:hypothetical protein [Bacteriophage Phobos]|uniref:Uncharacterized protein n=1 Tax=Bacteriophage Phobos TaxID=2662138 RepID=A0A5Q2UCE5_9CAUD|nr:hypothetical protein JT319_gp60 [Bacteriophage Phobos]QGH45029.1 hypothetical protein [Bacteriophage Phobos]WPK42361.1 hypothetical protein [Pseudomonas phage Ppu-503]